MVVCAVNLDDGAALHMGNVGIVGEVSIGMIYLILAVEWVRVYRVCARSEKICLLGKRSEGQSELILASRHTNKSS